MSQPKVDSPFVGLVPYTEEDAEFFFGRARDQQRILANLFASRLTILYGPSGVGKSSVLRAGIVQEVRRRIEKAHAAGEEPEVAVVYFKDWKGDILPRLRATIESALRSLLRKDFSSDLPSSLSLKELLQKIGQRFNGDLLLIFDQFEEYFLYHQNLAPDEFSKQLAEVANQSGLQANFLVALRDDAVTRLDRFKPLIPNLFSNYLRIGHLSGEDARMAIVEPIQRFNQLPEERKATAGSFSIEPQLVAMVIDEVRTGRVLIGRVGKGTLATTAGASVAVETPYLQLVMMKLWKEEVQLDSRTLRRETLQKLGGADTIVKSHLEAALAGLSDEERGLCARMFPHLVTPSGTKIAHTLGNLAKFAKATPERLAPLLEALAGQDKRLLAPVAPPDGDPGQLQYEIYHDSLAQAVLAWQARYEEDQERKAREKERHRLLVWAVALAMAFVLAVGAAVLAVSQWRSAVTARHRAKTAEAAALAARSDLQVQLLESKKNKALADHNQELAAEYAGQIHAAQEEGNSFRQQATTAGPTNAASSEKPIADIISERDKALKTVTDLQATVAALESQLKALLDSNATLKTENEGQSKQVATLTQKVESLNSQIENLKSDANKTGGVTGDLPLQTSLSIEELRTELLQRHLVPSSHNVNDFCFDATSSHVAIVLDDGSAKILETIPAAGSEVTLARTVSPIITVHFQQDQNVIAAFLKNGAINWFDAATGKFTKQPIASLPIRDFTSAGFSLAGNLLRTIGPPDPDSVDIWAFPSARHLYTVNGAKSVMWSEDDRKIASVGDDGTVRVIELPPNAKKPVKFKVKNHILDGCFTADAKGIAFATGRTNVSVFSVEDGHNIPDIDFATRIVRVSFNPDGFSAIAISSDGTAYLRVLKDRQTTEIANGVRNVYSERFSRDGRWLAILTDARDLTWYPIRIADLQALLRARN